MERRGLVFLNYAVISSLVRQEEKLEGRIKVRTGSPSAFIEESRNGRTYEVDYVGAVTASLLLNLPSSVGINDIMR